MKQYHNILVNALVNLGDVVLTTSAVALLKRAYPKAKVTMLVKPAVKQAVMNNPLIDQVIVFDYRRKGQAWKKMWQMVKQLRTQNFDLSISFDRKLRPAILCWLARIPVRVGPDRVFDDNTSRVTWLYTHIVHIAHDLDKTLQRETYQEIIRGFTGIQGHAVPVMARIEERNRKKAEQLLSGLPRADRYIALCVKGTFPLKTWPKEYFASLVKSLSERYEAAFFVVGAPGDKPYAQEVIQAVDEACGRSLGIGNYCGATTLPDLAAIIGRSSLFVTVDTGAAHVAATTGTPMVVMYGCTHPNRWHPASETAYVLTSDEPCSPCTCRAEECPSNPRPDCLWHVTPEMVLEVCREMLDEDKGEGCGGI